jgi:YARHG domain
LAARIVFPGIARGAPRGRFFRDPALAAHFGRFAWYRPYAWDVPLNAVEQANVRLIATLER